MTSPPQISDTKPPKSSDQRNADLDHLKLLWIAHVAVALLGLLGLVFLFGHYTFMTTFFSAALETENIKSENMPTMFVAFQEMAKWFYLLSGVYVVVTSIANFVSALALGKRIWRMFSIVVSVFNCLNIPLGTVLGIFTLIVLSRGSVVNLFEEREA